MRQYLATGMLLAVVVTIPSCLLAKNDTEKPPPVVNEALKMKCQPVHEEFLGAVLWRCQNVEVTCYLYNNAGLHCEKTGTILRSQTDNDDDKKAFSLM